jgi:hypothetical protein
VALEVEKHSQVDSTWRTIPGWAIALAAVGFVVTQVLMNTLVAKSPGAPPLIARIAIGILGGVVLAVYLLLVGYVNVDSKRRGMNRVLWTLLAAFVPNGLGIVLYFVLRLPYGERCPQCFAQVQSGYLFCPKCAARLQLTCPYCHRETHSGDLYCPYCGKGIAERSLEPARI